MLRNLERLLRKAGRKRASTVMDILRRLIHLSGLTNSERETDEASAALDTLVYIFLARAMLSSKPLTTEEMEERFVKLVSVNSLSANPVRARLAGAILNWIRRLL